MFVGNENIRLNTDELKKVPGFDKLNLQPEHIINEAHGDEVTKIPDLFFNAGYSKNCAVEIFIYFIE
jgi:GMP synthase-like glutamine amidotransferase